ncbi:hypothetical protein D030_5393B, partial [Vibrio parahaemolyticus AQ3810]
NIANKTIFDIRSEYTARNRFPTIRTLHL